MKHLFYILTILICLSSCQTKEGLEIEGDLYFKLIDFERLFDAPDSILIKYETSIKEVNKDTLNEQDKKMYKILEYMVDNKLLRKPFIRLRLDSGEVTMLFIDSSVYGQLKKYNCVDLNKEKKKVRIKAIVSELKYESRTAYISSRILSIDKIEGKTYWTK